MATMLPDDVHFPDGFHGEGVVWRALRDQLPDEAVVLHSTAIRQHGTEREVDLLVLWPDTGSQFIGMGRSGTVRAGLVRRVRCSRRDHSIVLGRL